MELPQSDVGLSPHPARGHREGVKVTVRPGVHAASVGGSPPWWGREMGSTASRMENGSGTNNRHLCWTHPGCGGPGCGRWQGGTGAVPTGPPASSTVGGVCRRAGLPAHTEPCRAWLGERECVVVRHARAKLPSSLSQGTTWSERWDGGRSWEPCLLRYFD